MNKLLTQYVETALWSSVDSDGKPLEDISAELSPCAKAKMKADLDAFLARYEALSLEDTYDLTNIVHDFWLTRNGHGAGFWDGDYSERDGELLTDLAHSFGECDLYVGDDNLIYCM